MKELSYNEEDVRKVRNFFQVDENRIKENIAILRTWISQQKHLPQNQDDDFLEKCLLRNKFRVEQTKKKLDAYYTLRGVYRECFQENNEEFVPSREETLFLPMPRLTSNQERLVFLINRNLDPELYDVPRKIKYYMLCSEVMFRNDYAVADRLIIDFQGYTLSHAKKITFSQVNRMITLYAGIYSGRLTSVDIINPPTFINVILGILKMGFPAKLYSRINVREKEDLVNIFPKECLPSDYGGKLASVDELAKTWDAVFDRNKEMFNRNYHNVSNESLRIGDLPKGDYFGVDGTFKKLNLD